MYAVCAERWVGCVDPMSFRSSAFGLPMMRGIERLREASKEKLCGFAQVGYRERLLCEECETFLNREFELGLGTFLGF